MTDQVITAVEAKQKSEKRDQLNNLEADLRRRKEEASVVEWQLPRRIITVGIDKFSKRQSKDKVSDKWDINEDKRPMRYITEWISN